MKSVFLILAAALVLSACSSKEKTKEEPVLLPVATSADGTRIDLWGIQRALRLERSPDNLGYSEKSFQTCEMGYGYSSSQNCVSKTFAVIHFRLQCRDSEGTVSNALGATELTAIAGKPIAWTLGDQSGTSVTDGEGFAQIRAVFSQSPQTKRLRLASASQFLHMRAGEVTRVVTPKPWCQR